MTLHTSPVCVFPYAFTLPCKDMTQGRSWQSQHGIILGWGVGGHFSKAQLLSVTRTHSYFCNYSHFERNEKCKVWSSFTFLRPFVTWSQTQWLVGLLSRSTGCQQLNASEYDDSAVRACIPSIYFMLRHHMH